MLGVSAYHQVVVLMPWATKAHAAVAHTRVDAGCVRRAGDAAVTNWLTYPFMYGVICGPGGKTVLYGGPVGSPSSGEAMTGPQSGQ